MANLVIDTISSTDTTASFNVANFGSARMVRIYLYQEQTEVYYTMVYLSQFRSHTTTVTNLTAGTTYTIRAEASPDDVTATVTTTGSPAPTPTGELDYWGSPYGSGAWGGIWKSANTIVNKTITGRARISKNTNKTITGRTRISKNVNKTIAGVVRIAKNVNKTITGKVDINKNSSKTITGIVMVSNAKFVDITGVVNIDNPNERVSTQTIAGIVRIQKDANKTITGRARIAKNDEKTVAGAVRIQKAQTATISGLSMIAKQMSNTITGKVKIRVATPEKLPVDWDYNNGAGPEDWSKNDKDATSWDRVEKPTDSWAENDKDATSWTDAGSAGATEWEYPLEDTA